MTMNKHDEHCKNIANDLIQLADGELYFVDGSMCESELDDNNNVYFQPYYSGEYYTETGEIITVDGVEYETIETEIEPASAWDYFEEYYNLDYIIDCNLEYTACRVMVACGGPNIYINTWDKCVELYWWTESGKAYLPGYVCDYIDEYFSEIYETQRGCI